jgi:hypothetical protein
MMGNISNFRKNKINMGGATFEGRAGMKIYSLILIGLSFW